MLNEPGDNNGHGLWDPLNMLRSLMNYAQVWVVVVVVVGGGGGGGCGCVCGCGGAGGGAAGGAAGARAAAADPHPVHRAQFHPELEKQIAAASVAHLTAEVHIHIRIHPCVWIP